MSSTTLKVSSRPGKKPMKNLPSSIEIKTTTTVEDVKKEIAKAIRMRDFNRIAILEPSKQSILKNRKAILKDEQAVMQSKEIMVKDLGPQISWKTVFLIEYIGPIVIHLLFLAIRPYVYSGVSSSSKMTTPQYLSLAMVVLHFIKRELETLFVHKFSNSTMPFFNVYKNSAHYWFLAGINIAYWVYAPNASAAKSMSDPTTKLLVYIGTALYVFGEMANLNTHMVLSNLRTPGGTERGIPRGFGFGLVTCPNYLFETIAWIGILLVNRSVGTFIFTLVAVLQMQAWAEGKEKALRKEFGDKYKSKSFPVIPGVPFIFSSGRNPKKAA